MSTAMLDHRGSPLVLRLGLALSLALGAAGGVLWSTRAPGPGLEPDSMSYLAAADSLVDAGELRVPFSEWSSSERSDHLRDFPPGFSLAIAALRIAGLPAERGAAWVEAASAFATVAGSALLVSAATTESAGAIASLAVLVTPGFVEDHTVVLSEPLFLALLVAVLALMASERPRVWALGLAAGAAPLVRYAGVALPLAAAARLALAPGPRHRRVAAAGLAAAPGAIAFLLWNHWAGGVREFGWKGDFGPTVLEGWDTLQHWLLPPLPVSPLRSVLAGSLLAGLVVLLIRGVGAARATSARAFRLLAAIGLTAASYASIVVFSRLFADAAIPFDDRIASPLFALSTLAVVTAVAVLWPSWPRSMRGAVVVGGLGWCVISARVSLHELRDLGEDGWGYASAAWKDSDLKKWLVSDGARYELFSDNGPSLYSMTHRSSRVLPYSADPETMRALGAVLRTRPSAVVAFEEPDAPVGARGGDFARRLGLRKVLATPDGSVYVPPPSVGPGHEAGGGRAASGDSSGRPEGKAVLRVR